MPFSQAFKLPTPTIILIAVLSLIDLAISSAYGHAVANAPLEYAAKEDHINRASTVSIVFYSGTVPLLSIFTSLIVLFLHLRSIPWIRCILMISAIITVGWITQVSIWLNCEVSGPEIAESVNSYCPQYPLHDQGSEVARALSGAKIAFAWILIIVELFFIGLCVSIIFGRKKEAKRGMPLQVESESEWEMRRMSGS